MLHCADSTDRDAAPQSQQLTLVHPPGGVVASADKKVSMVVSNELAEPAALHYFWKGGPMPKLLVQIKPGKTKTTLTAHGVKWQLVSGGSEHTWTVDAAHGATQQMRLHSSDDSAGAADPVADSKASDHGADVGSTQSSAVAAHNSISAGQSPDDNSPPDRLREPIEPGSDQNVASTANSHEDGVSDSSLSEKADEVLLHKQITKSVVNDQQLTLVHPPGGVVASADKKVSMVVSNELAEPAALHYFWKGGPLPKLLVQIKPGKTKTTLTAHGVKWQLVSGGSEHTWTVDAAHGATQQMRLHSSDDSAGAADPVADSKASDHDTGVSPSTVPGQVHKENQEIAPLNSTGNCSTRSETSPTSLIPEEICSTRSETSPTSLIPEIDMMAKKHFDVQNETPERAVRVSTELLRERQAREAAERAAMEARDEIESVQAEAKRLVDAAEAEAAAAKEEAAIQMQSAASSADEMLQAAVAAAEARTAVERRSEEQISAVRAEAEEAIRKVVKEGRNGTHRVVAEEQAQLARMEKQIESERLARSLAEESAREAAVALAQLMKSQSQSASLPLVAADDDSKTVSRSGTKTAGIDSTVSGDMSNLSRNVLPVRQVSAAAFEAATALFKEKAETEQAARADLEAQFLVEQQQHHRERQDLSAQLSELLNERSEQERVHHKLVSLVTSESEARSDAEARARLAIAALNTVQLQQQQKQRQQQSLDRELHRRGYQQAQRRKNGSTSTPTRVRAASPAGSSRGRVHSPGSSVKGLDSDGSSVGARAEQSKQHTAGQYKVGTRVLARASDTGVWQEAVIVKPMRTGGTLRYMVAYSQQRNLQCEPRAT
eukprot:SAG31_NODE_1876_length_7007_cov_4.001882_2_plen_835_part_00